MKNIKDLQDKYWNANSTLDEESMLRTYFKEHGDENSPEKALFEYFESERNKQLSKTFVPPKNTKVFQLKRYVLSIAATLILVACAYWLVNTNAKSGGFDYEVKDPEVALEMTKEALAFLNSKMDKGEQAIKDNIVHLDKTLIFKNL